MRNELPCFASATVGKLTVGRVKPKFLKDKMKGAERPNIVLIMTDQQPVSTVGAYGNEAIRTPNIDSLAYEGVKFERAYISATGLGMSRCRLSASGTCGGFPATRSSPSRRFRVGRENEKNAWVFERMSSAITGSGRGKRRGPSEQA